MNQRVMSCHYLTIIILIIGMGIFGGLLNFTIVHKSGSNWRLVLFKSIIWGIGASTLVPLFLRTISSNLIEFNVNNSTRIANYFFLSGFCLLAAIYSKRFIGDLFSRVVKAEENANIALEKATELEDVKSEVDDYGRKIKERIATEKNKKFSDEQVQQIIESFRKSSFLFRTINGIKEETKIPEMTIKEVLEYLKTNNLATSRKNSQDVEVWKLK